MHDGAKKDSHKVIVGLEQVMKFVSQQRDKRQGAGQHSTNICLEGGERERII